MKVSSGGKVLSMLSLILQFSAELVTFTEEILNEKLHFLCSVSVGVAGSSFWMGVLIGEEKLAHIVRLFLPLCGSFLSFFSLARQFNFSSSCSSLSDSKFIDIKEIAFIIC